MAKVLTVLFIALAFEALGVVLLKQGIDRITAQERARQGGAIKVHAGSVLRMIRGGCTNPRVLLGVLFEALFFAGLLYLMSQRDISFVWPLTTLSMVVTTFAAVVLLHEKVSGLRWAGVVLMVFGAALITWSEQKKEAELRTLKAAVEPVGGSK